MKVSNGTRGRLLVGVQFMLIALIALAPGGRLWRSSPWLVVLEVVLLFGSLVILVLAFFHLGSALTANPVPKTDAPLQTNGIYAYVRHPIYTGVLLAGFGIAIYRASVVSLLTFIALVLLLNFKARWEESFLRAKHGGYLSYMEQVPRFLPRKKREKHGS